MSTNKKLNAAAGQVQFFKDLAEWLDRWGHRVTTYPDWQTCQAGTTRKASIRTLTIHHTAGDGTTLKTLFRTGNGKVCAPLCNIAITRGKTGQAADGVPVLGAAGYTNSEGNNELAGFTRVYSGKEDLTQYTPRAGDSSKSLNRYGISVEVCATGTMSAKQWATAVALAAAFCTVRNGNKVKGAARYVGYIAGHKELTRRKPTDPAENMGDFRKAVKAFIAAKTPTPAPATPAPMVIVAGSGNTAQDTLHAKYARRLDVVLQLMAKDAKLRVVVTGGVKAGHKNSEAALAKAYLMAHGIDAGRILTEAKSGSTNGNFVYGIPIAKAAGATSLTVVSDFSHMRRCLAFCYAANRKLEDHLDAAAVAWFADQTAQDATVAQTVEQTKAVWSGMTASTVKALDDKFGITG